MYVDKNLSYAFVLDNMTQKEGEELGTSITGLVSENDTTEVEIDIFYETKERVETTGMYKTEYLSHEQYAFNLGAIFNIYSCTAPYLTCVNLEAKTDVFNAF